MHYKFKTAERSPQQESFAQDRQAELSAVLNKLADKWAANPTPTAPKQYPGPIVAVPSAYGQLQDYDYGERWQRSIYGQAYAQRQDWIDYGQAEAALFEALKPELQLIASDHARQFGEDVAETVEDVAATVYPKAVAILFAQRHIRVFSDDHLWAKCKKWAAWWCAKYAQQYKKREHTKYSAESAALGRDRSKAKRSNKADIRACLAQCYQHQGQTIRTIADRLGVAVGTASNALKRPVATLFAVLWAYFAQRVHFGKNSLQGGEIKYNSLSTRTLCQNEHAAQFLPLRALKPPAPPPPDLTASAEIDAIGEQIASASELEEAIEVFKTPVPGRIVGIDGATVDSLDNRTGVSPDEMAQQRAFDFPYVSSVLEKIATCYDQAATREDTEVKIRRRLEH